MMEFPLALRGILVITAKNMRLYYTKPPVLMFGLLFPLFMFFAFFVGRKLDLATFFPAFLAMMLFFTASSVGPLITPWEKRDKTYERLLSYPVTQDSIILGDVAAGAIFGIGISLVIWITSSLFVPVTVTNPGLFAFAFGLLHGFGFAGALKEIGLPRYTDNSITDIEKFLKEMKSLKG